MGKTIARASQNVVYRQALHDDGAAKAHGLYSETLFYILDNAYDVDDTALMLSDYALQFDEERECIKQGLAAYSKECCSKQKKIAVEIALQTIMAAEMLEVICD